MLINLSNWVYSSNFFKFTAAIGVFDGIALIINKFPPFYGK